MNDSQVKSLVNVLLNSAKSKKSTKNQNSLYTFHYPEPLLRFISRVNETIRCSPCCYVAALMYMDRITELNQQTIQIDFSSVHLLFITSLLVANQFIDDKPERSLQYASLLNMSVVSVEMLKTDFLFRIHFHLLFSDKEFEAYTDRLNWNQIEIPPKVTDLVPRVTRSFDSTKSSLQ
eukprot:c17276_g1_i1.p1 GENE.c17276_g1_i1~~c17276_g1_i1.p1  ORF type:complete len:177 (-),score=46.06 c17276_g1_i1:35-565(-)